MASFVLQILTGDAVGVQLNFLRRAGGDDPAAGLTAAGAHVDEKVRVADDVEVVLDDHDRCAVVQKRLEDAEQHANIQRMQADGRLVKDKHCVMLGLAHLAGQFQPLRFSAGKAGCLLAKGQVAKAKFL